LWWVARKDIFAENYIDFFEEQWREQMLHKSNNKQTENSGEITKTPENSESSMADNNKSGMETVGETENLAKTENSEKSEKTIEKSTKTIETKKTIENSEKSTKTKKATETSKPLEKNSTPSSVKICENSPFDVGDKVWVKLKGHQWWPSQVIQHTPTQNDKNDYVVIFYGDNTFGFVNDYTPRQFQMETFEKNVDKYRKKVNESAVEEALSMLPDEPENSSEEESE